METWKNYKLGDFIKIKHGYAFKGKYISLDDNGIVLVTPGNFAIGGGFQEKKCKFYTSDYPENYVLNTDDLIVTMTDLSKDGDTLGYSAKVPYSDKRIYLHNQRIGLVQFKNELIYKDYLYWYMRSKIYQKTVLSTASGSTVRHTSPERICDIPIHLPPFDTQKRIASILSSLDDRIKLNNNINDNLVEQLRLLFQISFLNGKHPEWPVKKLGDYITLERGLSYKGKYLSDNEGVPMVNLGNILPNSVFRPEKLKYYTGEFKPKVVVKPGDIVVANTDLTQAREVLGSAIMIPDLGYPTIICSHHISIVKHCKLPKSFIHGMLNSPTYRERVIGYATGTTVLALPNETILNCEFSLPPNELIAEYDTIAKSYNDKVEEIRKENQQLAIIRNQLLPKLISGEIDVSEVL